MVTGNNLVGSLAYKKTLHLTPDKHLEQELEGTRCIVLIRRSAVSALKLVDKQKVSELVQFEFSHCSNDGNWSTAVEGLLSSPELNEFVSGCEAEYWIDDSRISIIPSALFSDDKKEEAHELLFEPSNGLNYISESAATSDFQMVSAVPQAICDILPAEPKNAFALWLERIENQTTGKHHAAILARHDEFNLTVFNRSELVFSNWFGYSKPEDLLYFLMATLESLNILHTEATLSLAGDIEKGGAAHKLISKYIGKVSFASRPKQLGYSYSFSKVEEHKHPLILSAACG